jgi:hypothetical protein
MAIGAALALLITARTTDASRRRTVARATSPDKSRVALALERRCGQGTCQDLRMGASEESAADVATLAGQSCDEVVWTPDGKRIGFVIDGREMRLYDAGTLKLAGIVGLLTSEAAESRRARGVTFSENGRAVTFDDCPRAHSGCRAGVAGVPQ